MASLLKYTKYLLLIVIIIQANCCYSQREKEIVAKRGDNITKILIKQNMATPEYMDEFVAINKGKFTKNNGLIVGKKYKLPTPKTKKKSKTKKNVTNLESGTYGTFEIFGEDYQDVEYIDSSLEGTVFYIVSGHGGPDPGAMGMREGHNLCEDEYAYDISLRMARELIKHRAIPYIIIRDPNDGIRDDEYLKPDKDEYCWGNKKIPLNQTNRLDQRIEVINSYYEKYKGFKNQILIEIHVDSRNEGKKIDLFFYYHSKSADGKNIAETLYKTIEQKYNEHQPNRGYMGEVKPRDNLYMIKMTNPKTVYIEIGNIQNSYDQIRLIKASNRQALAEWLTAGMINYVENEK